jgi:hypothetical protein
MLRKPIVLAMEPEGNPHEHGMIRECCTYRVSDLEDALSAVFRILMP